MCSREHYYPLLYWISGFHDSGDTSIRYTHQHHRQDIMHVIHHTPQSCLNSTGDHTHSSPQSTIELKRSTTYLYLQGGRRISYNDTAYVRSLTRSQSTHTPTPPPTTTTNDDSTHDMNISQRFKYTVARQNSKICISSWHWLSWEIYNMQSPKIHFIVWLNHIHLYQPIS